MTTGSSSIQFQSRVISILELLRSTPCSRKADPAAQSFDTLFTIFDHFFTPLFCADWYILDGKKLGGSVMDAHTFFFVSVAAVAVAITWRRSKVNTKEMAPILNNPSHEHTHPRVQRFYIQTPVSTQSTLITLFPSYSLLMKARSGSGHSKNLVAPGPDHELERS